MSSLRTERQTGMVLVVVIAMFLPIVVLASSAVTVMNAKAASSLESRDQKVALSAAESGVDTVIHRARLGTLESGKAVIADLQPDLGFHAIPTHLGTDTIDNDGDDQTDEFDEQLFEVVVTGFYRRATRRIVCYVGPILRMPSITGAINLQDGTADVSIDGASFRVRGTDTDLDGSAGDGAPVPGIQIAQPGTTDTINSKLNKQQEDRVTGLGGTPSVQEDAETLDLPAILDELRVAAHNVLPGGSYDELPGPESEWQITYIDGDLDLGGSPRASGVLAVAGDAVLSGSVEFDGLVIVLGNVKLSGGGSGAMIRGGLICGGDLTLKGTVDVLFSSEAAEKVREIALRRRLMGWREIGRDRDSS